MVMMLLITMLMLVIMKSKERHSLLVILVINTKLKTLNEEFDFLKKQLGLATELLDIGKVCC